MPNASLADSASMTTPTPKRRIPPPMPMPQVRGMTPLEYRAWLHMQGWLARIAYLTSRGVRL